jgi:hypothetical protein
MIRLPIHEFGNWLLQLLSLEERPRWLTDRKISFHAPTREGQIARALLDAGGGVWPAPLGEMHCRVEPLPGGGTWLTLIWREEIIWHAALAPVAAAVPAIRERMLLEWAEPPPAEWELDRRGITICHSGDANPAPPQPDLLKWPSAPFIVELDHEITTVMSRENLFQTHCRIQGREDRPPPHYDHRAVYHWLLRWLALDSGHCGTATNAPGHTPRIVPPDGEAVITVFGKTHGRQEIITEQDWPESPEWEQVAIDLLQRNRRRLPGIFREWEVFDLMYLPRAEAYGYHVAKNSRPGASDGKIIAITMALTEDGADYLWTDRELLDSYWGDPTPPWRPAPPWLELPDDITDEETFPPAVQTMLRQLGLHTLRVLLRIWRGQFAMPGFLGNELTASLGWHRYHETMLYDAERELMKAGLWEARQPGPAPVDWPAEQRFQYRLELVTRRRFEAAQQKWRDYHQNGGDWKDS